MSKQDQSQEAYNPEAFWYSKINDYRFCPAYYKAKYIDGIKFDEKSLDLEFGTALHLGINDVLTGGDGVGIFNIYWDSLIGQELKQSKYNHEILAYNGVVLIERFAWLHAKHFKLFKAEERIYSIFGNYLVEGTPDFLGDYKGVPSVVDFKTSGSRYLAEKIRCEEQLSMYGAMAMKELGYEPKQRVYVVFVKDYKAPSIQVLTSKLTTTIMNDTVDNMVLTIEEIKARDRFPRNPSSCVRGTFACPNFERCWGKK